MVELEVQIGPLRATVVGRPAQARFGVVVLHGYRMRPADLSPFAHSLGLPGVFVFPQGRLAVEAADATCGGRAWWSIDPDTRAAASDGVARDFARQSPAGLEAARLALCDFLQDLRSSSHYGGGFPVFLVGFSQGGMLISDTLMRGANVAGLAGVALFSTCRIAASEWPEGVRMGGLPVLVCHGRQDDEVSFSAGEALADAWKSRGAAVTFRAFDHGHGMPLVAWRALRHFLLEQAPPVSLTP